MIHTIDDFFNKVAKEIESRYFPGLEYYRDNDSCAKAHYDLELFSNGCLTYRQLIGRLAKSCQTNNATIHNLVEKYIISFGDYQYKPRKLYSENKIKK